MAADWLAPSSLEEALALRAQYGDDATVVAGGTFLAILLNQRLIAPSKLLALRNVPGIDGIRANGDLRLGALVTHSAVDHSAAVRERWPAVARRVLGRRDPAHPQPGNGRWRARRRRLRV